LKDAKGDDEAANKALLDRAGGGASGDETPEGPELDATIEDAVIEEEEKEPQEESDEDPQQESDEEIGESDAVDESEPNVAEAPAYEIIDVIPEPISEPEAGVIMAVSLVGPIVARIAKVAFK
jgi:hypothetical protein